MSTAIRRGLLAAFATGLVSFAAAASGPDDPAPAVLFDPAPAPAAARPEGGLIVQAEPGGWERLLAGPARLEIPVFPLRAGGVAGAGDGAPADVTLQLERFSVARPGARFVLGQRGGRDRALAFDPGSVKLYRGPVEGVEGSWAVLAASERQSVGLISVGEGRMYAVSSRARGGGTLAPGQLSVFPVTAAADLAPGVELCRIDHGGDSAGAGVLGSSRPGEILGLRQLEVAIETDYEFFSLFGDAAAAAEYVVQLYAVVSDIYIREINTRIDLTFVRIWDDPADLFNEPEPLNPFRAYWNEFMGHVPRDIAQFLTGRRDLSAGGVAYVNSVCTGNGYSWAGYALGHFADPDRPHGFNRDITVSAHEIGHNCGTLHTHDYGLDDCDRATLVAQRGTIMSYCGQTYSGGAANTNVSFHTVTRNFMREFLATRACMIDDCNQNGVSDGDDISGGFSADVNGDGIPDECQDCDGDGRLDPEQIAAGISEDLNFNGIPDECEPDCNGNGVPDDIDISGRYEIMLSDDFETDLGWTAENLGAISGDWERGVPVNDPAWEYDPISDSDGSGQCWLTENDFGNTDVDEGAVRLTSPRLDLSFGQAAVGYDYFLRLTRQRDEDRLLVEMSDDDGLSWRTVTFHDVNGGLNWRSHVITEANMRSAGLTMTDRMRIRFTANDGDPQSIVEAAIDAFFTARFVPPTSLDLTFNEIPDECEPDCDGDGVADYLQITADMPLDKNRDLILDSCQDCDGDGVIDIVDLQHAHFAWVTSLEDEELYEFFSATGVRTGVTEGAAIKSGADVLITPDGRILVSSALDSRIAEFDVSGTHVRDLVSQGAGGLAQPGTMLLHPGGAGLLVASELTDSVKLYDLDTGAFIRDFVAPGAGGLIGPFGLAMSAGGDLLVTSADNQALRYDGATGAFIDVFVDVSDNGGLDLPRSMLVMPDGRLLIASYNTTQVLEFDGETGAFIRQFNKGGTVDRLVLDEPWGIRLGPDGFVYVSVSGTHALWPTGELHLTNARIFQFHPESGFLIRAYVLGNDTGLYHPSGFDFFPGDHADCNLNYLPDNCDIASGFSQDCNANGVPDDCDIRLGTSLDANGNGIPDECECYADCDLSGGLDFFDFLCFQNAFAAGEGYADCDGSGGLDFFDFLCFQNEFAAGCE